MENTLVIMQYHADTMRHILDNLVVWDREKKVHYAEVIKYKEEKKTWRTGSCYMFTITAIKEPLLVFYTIGQEVERRINKPEHDMSPKFQKMPLEEERKRLDGIDFDYVLEKARIKTGKKIKMGGMGLVCCDDGINDCDFCDAPEGCTFIIDGYTLKDKYERIREDFYICKKCATNKK